MVSSIESCRYDYYASCFYLPDKLRDAKRCGEISIIGKNLQLTDIELQGTDRDGSSYNQRIDYMTDLPKAEYSQDKEFPFVTVLINNQGNFPQFQVLASDYYHLLMTIKKSRLTLKIEVIDSEVARKLFLRAIATKIPWSAGYNLANNSYQLILHERGQKIPAEIRFEDSTGKIYYKVQSRNEEKFNFYDLTSYIFPGLGRVSTPTKGDSMEFSLWFKGHQMPVNMSLPNLSFDLRAKTASNFYRDIISFIRGNSSKWRGENPYVSDYNFRFNFKNHLNRDVDLEFCMNQKDRRDIKIIIREGSVSWC